MPCYQPRDAWMHTDGGKPVFQHPYPGDPNWTRQPIGCGHCLGCMTMRATEWTTKCYCEAKMHEANSFLTLTYDDKHMPAHRMLCKRDVQLFLKRLRKHIEPKHCRYYYAAEYGGRTWRPHYHICCFGHDFYDRTPYKKSKGGYQLFESKTLTALWGMGICTLQEMTPETAGYAARYCTKKRDPGKTTERPKHYVKKADRAGLCIDRITGEQYRYVPEFHGFSKHPALGLEFLEKYFFDVWNQKGIVMPGGLINPIPKTFMQQIQKWSQADFEELKAIRKAKAFDNIGDTMPNRLEVREIVARARLNLSARDEL